MEIKQAFFILRHGSSKGLPEYLEAVKTIEDKCPPVVRCHECKRWDADPDGYGKSNGPTGRCMKSFEVTEQDDFCSYAERRESSQ